MTIQNDESIEYAGILEGLAPALEYTPDERETKIVSNFYKLFDAALEAKGGFTRSWEYNRLMIEGEQLLYRDELSHEYVKVTSSQSNGRLLSINNKLQPAARNLHGKLCRAHPKFSVVPSTTDQTQMHGSVVANAFLRYFDNHHKIDLLWSVMKFCDVYAGNSCIQLAWDPMGGRTIAGCLTCDYTSDDEDLIGAPCPDCADIAGQAVQAAGEADALEESMGGMPQGLPQVDVPNLVEIKEGEECPIVHKIENVFPDHSVTDGKDARFITIRHNMPLSEARRMFVEKGVYLRASMGKYIDDINYRTLDQDSGVWSRAAIDDHVTVFEYHERSTEQFPQGRILWIANNMVLKEGEGHYKDFKRLPFFFNHWWKYPTRLWAQSFVDSAASRQRELNEFETSMREYQELFARGKVLAPIGSISPDEWTSRVSQIVLYNRNVGKPELVMPPSMPQSSYERRDSLVGDINEHATVTATDAGAQNDDSGRALAILQAAGDQQIEGIIKYNRSEMAEFYRCVLILVKEKYRPDRKFIMLGDSGPELYSFEDLQLASGWDIVLEQDDGLSNNRSIRLTEAMNLAQMGVFTDPQTGMFDRMAFAKNANLKLYGLGPDTDSTEKAAAQACVKRIEKGDLAIKPEVCDDPKIFAASYLNWLRTKGRLPATKREAIDLVEQLYMYYIKQIMLAEASQPTEQAAPTGSSNSASKPAAGTTSAQTASAPGGTPVGGGVQQRTAAGPSIAGAAGQAVQSADRAGEQMSRVAAHES